MVKTHAHEHTLKLSAEVNCTQPQHTDRQQKRPVCGEVTLTNTSKKAQRKREQALSRTTTLAREREAQLNIENNKTKNKKQPQPHPAHHQRQLAGREEHTAKLVL